MSKKYRREAMAAIHEIMETLLDVGAIEKQTMRRLMRLGLPIRKIKALREKEHVSQTVFAN